MNAERQEGDEGIEIEDEEAEEEEGGGGGSL
jgi:hypothetical protein